MDSISDVFALQLCRFRIFQGVRHSRHPGIFKWGGSIKGDVGISFAHQWVSCSTLFLYQDGVGGGPEMEVAGANFLISLASGGMILPSSGGGGVFPGSLY